jgi:hypothetical protein
MSQDNLEVKRMYSADDRRSMAKTGDAMPDGSFPIADEEDLKNAIAAFGRAKDPEAAKTHIIARATDLGAEELIPATWGEDSMEKKMAHDDEKMADNEDIDEMDPDAEGGEIDLSFKRKKKMAHDEESDEEILDEEDPEIDPEKELEGKSVVTVDASGAVTKCAKGLAGGDCGYKSGSKVCGKCGGMAVQTKNFDENLVEVMRLDITDEDERAAYRRLYLEDLGTKSGDIDDGAFSCMQEQKVLSGGTAPCADCNGGCMGTKGLPDLAEMEAVAGTLFGKVLDSGYSETVDRFLVAVQRPEGIFEVQFDGKSGNFETLLRLPEDWIADAPLITAEEAITAAEGEIQGKAIAIDSTFLEGDEVYAVEIDGIDGKSYDVYVDPSSGTVLAYDAYEFSADDVDNPDVVLGKGLEADPEFLANFLQFQLIEAEQDTPSAE